LFERLEMSARRIISVAKSPKIVLFG